LACSLIAHRYNQDANLKMFVKKIIAQMDNFTT